MPKTPNSLTADQFRQLVVSGVFGTNKKGKLILNCDIPEQENKPGVYILNVNMMGKPRMTKSDKWKKRPATDKYWSLKDQILEQAGKQNLHGLPMLIKQIHFTIPMPESWSKQKRYDNDGKYHTQKPDIDNLVKSLFDCLCKDDSGVAAITNGFSKRWGREGKVFIEL